MQSDRSAAERRAVESQGRLADDVQRQLLLNASSIDGLRRMQDGSYAGPRTVDRLNAASTLARRLTRDARLLGGNGRVSPAPSPSRLGERRDELKSPAVAWGSRPATADGALGRGRENGAIDGEEFSVKRYHDES
jgi:hypothetical protein